MESFDKDKDVINMVNDKKYENDTAFFGIVEENAKKVEKAIAENERVNEYFVATDRAVQDSIKKTDSKIALNNYIDERAKQLKRQRNIKIGALILAGATIVGGMAYAGKRVSEQQDISKATSIVKDEADDKLIDLATIKTGSFTYSNNDNVGQMVAPILDENDYSRLDVDSIEKVYAYMQTLPKDEFEQFIRGMQYTNDEGTYNYISFKQYLNIQGFSNETEFVNRAQAVLLEAYRNGTLTNDAAKSKGGK